MVEAAFFDFFGIIGFIIILYSGLKLIKYKIRNVKIIGYIFIVIGILGLLIDIYNVINNYIIPLF